jgi:hypothetical protein
VKFEDVTKVEDLSVKVLRHLVNGFWHSERPQHLHCQGQAMTEGGQKSEIFVTTVKHKV